MTGLSRETLYFPKIKPNICLQNILRAFLLPFRKEFYSFLVHFLILTLLCALNRKFLIRYFSFLQKLYLIAQILPLKHKKISKKLGFFKFGVCLSLIQVGGFAVGRRLAPPSDTLALRARAPKTSTRETAE